MKKNNVRIKENITFQDELNAIDYITASNFQIDENGEVSYTPEYTMSAEMEAYAMFFIDGVEFESGDIKYERIMNDEQLVKMIKRFYFSETNKEANRKNSQLITIRNFVMNNVQRKVEFNVQKLIHTSHIESDLSYMINTITNVISSFDMTKFKELDIKTVMRCMKKIADSEIEISPEFLTKIFKEVIKFDDKTAEIIDTKNEKIRELENLLKQKKSGDDNNNE